MGLAYSEGGHTLIIFPLGRVINVCDVLNLGYPESNRQALVGAKLESVPVSCLPRRILGSTLF